MKQKIIQLIETYEVQGRRENITLPMFAAVSLLSLSFWKRMKRYWNHWTKVEKICTLSEKNYKNLDKHIEDIFAYQLSNGHLDGLVFRVLFILDNKKDKIFTLDRNELRMFIDIMLFSTYVNLLFIATLTICWRGMFSCDRGRYISYVIGCSVNIIEVTCGFSKRV